MTSYIWIDHPKKGVLVEPGTHGQHELKFVKYFGMKRMRWLEEGGGTTGLLSGYAWKSWRGNIMISVSFKDRADLSWLIPPHVRDGVVAKLGGRLSRKMLPWVG